MSERAAEYQEQVTGSPPGTEYVVDGVAFDGFGDDTLKDAKGPGYEHHIDEDGQWKPYFKGADSLVAQAERQLLAADGTPIEWSIAEEKAADTIRNMLQDAGFGDIEVVYAPPK
ncbi:Tox-REase-5 domain-containing protein [Rhodococcus sovatensis]|jgi:hypothetical protein|uniref:Tox-REase-5 domain-containing protein n=1 Tax=Rhodococcus sovatensis TaxID=1805840 RepID=A0ABZ2PF10_9NOCA